MKARNNSFVQYYLTTSFNHVLFCFLFSFSLYSPRDEIQTKKIHGTDEDFKAEKDKGDGIDDHIYS